MSGAADLLRLLEPAVRPGGLPGPTRAAAPGPIEARSFESILEEAQGMGVNPAEDAPAEMDRKPAGPLSGLAGVDRIENPSLRRIVGGLIPLPLGEGGRVLAAG